MQVNLLGPVELSAPDGQQVPLGSAKRRTVLAALALELNRVVPGDRLLALVWDGAPPPRAKAALQGHVAQLRKVLGGGVALVTRAPGYALTGERSAVDLFRFEDQVAAARACAEDARAAEGLAAALRLWRGPVLADVPVEGLREAAAARARELRLAAVEELAVRLTRLGRADEVLARLDEEVRAHPLREPLVARSVLALHATGRQAEAIDLFHATRARLADELGVDPGPELRAAYQAVLAGEAPAGEQPPRGGAAPVPAQLPREHRGFVGRDAELADLQRWLAGQECAIGLLVGPAGVGKTALALRWAHRAAEHFPDGQLFANLRGFDETGPVDPGTALVGFLRALGLGDDRIAPDLEDQAAQYRSLLAGRRVLVVLDNARSTEQVRPLLPGAAGCLVLLTSRHRLDDLVATEGALPVRVPTLPESGAEDLLAAVLGRDRVDREPDAVAELVRLCDGLPLALRVAGARLAARPQWAVRSLVDELRDEQSRLSALTLPDAGRGVRAALAVSHRQLPAGAARLLRLLGLHPGADLDSHAAAALLDVGVGTARTHLRTLAYASLLEETASDRYTRHDLVRLFTRELVAAEPDADAAADRLLDYYLQVADRGRAHLSDHARPLERGGREFADAPALDSHEAALAWFTTEEANLTLAMDLAARRGRPRHAWQLALCLDALHFRRGNRRDRIPLCRAGLAAARELGDAHASATLLLRLGSTLADLGRIEEAIDHCARAADLAGDDGHLRAAALANLGYCLLADGRLAEADEHMRRALALAARVGDARCQAGVLNNLANLLLARGDAAAALDRAERARALFAALPPAKGHAATLHTIGSALHRLDRAEEALRAYRAGLELAEELGDRYQQALCHHAIGDVLERTQGPGAARPHWREAWRRYQELRLQEAGGLADKVA